MNGMETRFYHLAKATFTRGFITNNNHPEIVHCQLLLFTVNQVAIERFRMVSKNHYQPKAGTAKNHTKQSPLALHKPKRLKEVVT